MKNFKYVFALCALIIISRHDIYFTYDSRKIIPRGVLSFSINHKNYLFGRKYLGFARAKRRKDSIYMLTAMVVNGRFYINSLGQLVSFPMPDLPARAPEDPLPPPVYVTVEQNASGEIGTGGSFLSSDDGSIIYSD